MTKGKSILLFSTLTVLGTYFLFLGLSKAQAFLAPLATAMILSLLVLPISRKMERGFLSRGVASFIGTFLLLLFSIAFMTILSLQVKQFVNDWPEIQQTMAPKMEQLKTFVFEHTFLKKEDLREYSNSGGFSFMDPASRRQQAVDFFTSFLTFLGSYLLTIVYVFFLLNYRRRFKRFLLRLFPAEKRQQVEMTITNSANVAQQYLLGKLLTIFFVAVIYAIGLGISGVENFILASALLAFFTLIPYLGNILALSMALAFGYLTSGETSALIGVLITFSVAELVESYVLQPYVVGDKVDLHPFVVIVGVILGNMVWGIIGMVLAIPVLGILSVVFRNIKVLRPFGFLLSKNDPGTWNGKK